MSSSAMTTILEIARPDCAAEVLQDEVVALNVETGIYFSMRGLAVPLWHDLAAGYPVEELARHANGHGDGAERVTDFAAQITRHGLMRPCPPRPVASEMASAGLLADGAREIVFEIYEDMQDLILSDPIHDVDETMGWPGLESQGT
jgi:hypothetical protein